MSATLFSRKNQLLLHAEVGNVEWGHFVRKQKTQQQKRRIMDGMHFMVWDVQYPDGIKLRIEINICMTRGLWSEVRQTDFKI